jgi:hypothetical protein
MSRSYRLSIFRRLSIALIIGCLALLGSGLRVQAAQGGLGCLEIHGFTVSRYDLTRGISTDLYSALIPKDKAFETSSPDGKHRSRMDENGQLIIASSEGKTQRIVRLPDSSTPADRPLWSPNSRNIAFAVTTPARLARLIIAPVDSRPQQVFEIPDSVDYALPTLEWSPDSQHIAVLIFERNDNNHSPLYSFTINLYGVNGTRLVRAVQHAVVDKSFCGEVCYANDPYTWSRDGRSLLYVRRTPGSKDQLDAMAYRLDRGQSVTLAKNLAHVPVYDKDGNHALIDWQDQNKTFAAVLDTATGQIATLDGQSSPVRLQWLGNTALARWESYLVWSKADGSGKRQLTISPEKMFISEWSSPISSWSRDEQWLAQVAYTMSANLEYASIWLVNLSTGKARTYIKRDIPRLIDGKIFSPDSQLAILADGVLYLLSLTDEKIEPIKLDPPVNVFDLQQFVWSPDNSMFAVIPRTQPDLYLVRRDGTQLRHYANFPPQHAPALHSARWTDCQ